MRKSDQRSPGFDPLTGMHRDTSRWAIAALFNARPVGVNDHIHWLNALAALASALTLFVRCRSGTPNRRETSLVRLGLRWWSM